MGITNPVAIESESAPWITEAVAGFVSLECQVDYALEPQTVTLRFQSEYTSFKKGTAYLTFGGNLSGQYYGEAAAEGIVGYYQAECLIPCPASEADGSPSTLVDWWENNPDIKIDGIFILNNEPRGLKISWHRESTMVLQTCDDLLSWRNYCWIHVTPPTTTWTSTVPLEAIGKYYRLQLFSIP